MNITIRPRPIIITAPATEPVSLAELKDQLRLPVGDTEQDAMLSRYITAARVDAEHQIGRALITQTVELRFDAFPDDAIELARAPVQSITSIVYTDEAGVDQVLSPALYVLDAAAEPGYVKPVYGGEWPATLDTINAVRVRYVAGYGDDAAAVPAPIRQWIVMHAAAMYRNAEAFTEARNVAELPNRFVDRLLDPFRAMGL